MTFNHNNYYYLLHFSRTSVLDLSMNEWQFVFQIKYYYLLKFKYTRFTDLRLEAGMRHVDCTKWSENFVCKYKEIHKYQR